MHSAWDRVGTHWIFLKWMRTGLELAAGPCLLNQPLWVSSWDAYNGRLQRGKILTSSHLSVWKAARAWLLSKMESSWGRESVIAELHYFLSHHLSLFSPPPPMLTNSVQKRYRSHSDSLQGCIGSAAFLLYPMECKDIAYVHSWPEKKKKKKSTTALYLFSGNCLRNVRGSWKFHLNKKMIFPPMGSYKWREFWGSPGWWLITFPVF